MTNDIPTVYWISGSPPAWRVLLGLAFKEIAHESRLLSADKQEPKAPDYLKLNPRGQVPTLTHGDVVVRESIAILAYLDAAFPAHPLFGRTPAETGAIWQAIMEHDNNLRPAIGTVGRVIFRNQIAEAGASFAEATATSTAELARLETTLGRQSFLAGEAVSAADCVAYPAIAVLARLMSRTSADVPADAKALVGGRPAIAAWQARIEALPGFADTYPPHWRS